MRRPVWFFSGLIVSLALGGLPAWSQDSAGDQARSIFQQAVADPSDKEKVDAFVKALPEIPSGSGHYIVEGDISLSREEIEPYLRSFTTTKPLQSGELIVNVVGNQSDYLKEPERRKVTYAVNAGSFPTADNATFAKARFQEAANDWVAACPECGISFTEVPANEAYFSIVYQPDNGGTVARSFFPSSASTERQLVIFAPYFSPSLKFDRAGVLRHELGHILGYRHEHIRNIPGCYGEDSNWRPITPYTPKSVMHYFCGGGGTLMLSLQDADKRGHRCLYLTGEACPNIK